MNITPVIFGCEGTSLTQAEKAFFAKAQPAGLIIFSRNVDNRVQLKQLVDSFLDCIQHPYAFVLVDQEGGRVQRLAASHWQQWLSADIIGTLYQQDKEAGLALARAHARSIAAALVACGIRVNAAPVLDIRFPEGHDVIGNRSFGHNIDHIIALGRETVASYIASGVMPVIKHMPGHGRATSDSHFGLPRIDVSESELLRTDAAPFISLKDTPAAIVSHLLYSCLDKTSPLTFSADGIAWLRNTIGYQGLLVSDCLHMKALEGAIAQKVYRSLQSGLDLAIDSHSTVEQKEQVYRLAGQAKPATITRLQTAWNAFPYGQTKPDVQDEQRIMQWAQSAGTVDPSEVLVQKP